MASFFKKALSVFVEFDDEQKEAASSNFQASSLPVEISRNPDNHTEAEKFEKYFEKLFTQANLPGPDYFEFYKMMETLETHIPDEKARLAATFASLSIQGLTKQTLIDTANKYKVIIEKDRNEFERALNEKLKTDVGQKQNDVQDLEKKIVDNSEQIQKLTREITECQALIGKLKTEVLDAENKLRKNNNGYRIASLAIINKIASDIQKIQSTV